MTDDIGWKAVVIVALRVDQRRHAYFPLYRPVAH